MYQDISIWESHSTMSPHKYSLIQNTISAATRMVATQLDAVPRVWNNKETVWVHTEETILLAKKYREIIKTYGWSLPRIIDLLQVHDIPEILTGDMDPRKIKSNKKYPLEDWAMTNLISNPNDRDLWYEYSSGDSLDAQFAKAFDKLQFLNELIKLWDINEYNWALKNYRLYFEPFPELLKIVDSPKFPDINYHYQKAA